MTETPQQTPPPGDEHEAPHQPSQGWNTENLKDYRRLRRSHTDRKVAGVAGGLGRHLDIDPTILRVLFVVMVFFGGAGLLLYGALWLFVPEEHTEDTVIRTSDSTRNALLISAAVVAGLLAIGDTWNGYGFPWPLAILGLVVAAVLMSRDRNRADVPPGPSVPAPGTPSSAPYAPTAPSGEDAGTATFPTAGYPAAPAPAAPWYPPTPPVLVAPRNPRKTGPILFGIALALVALALGVLGLVDASGVSVDDAAYPALALAVIGGMLLVGSFVGRAGGLIAIGVIASLVLAATAVSNPSYDGDRDVVIRPTSAAAVQDSYDVPAGRIELDLTRVADPENLDGRSLELDVNVGEIVVIVPDDVDVTYDARIDYGGVIDTPTETRDGWESQLTGELESGSNSSAQLDLDVDLRMGHIELRQS